MPFQFHLDILDWIFKGILIGIVASAPMGPVGVLCIQRTLNKGRWYGLVTGIGATISDFIYALITGFGMSRPYQYKDIRCTPQMCQGALPRARVSRLSEPLCLAPWTRTAVAGMK